MRERAQRLIRWVSGLTGWLRCLVIALGVHIAIFVILGSVKIAVTIAPIAAKFIDPGSVSAVSKPVDDIDPFAPLRDYDYNGPTLGSGGGTPGKGPGGIPTAAGTTPTEYKASIQSAGAHLNDKAAGEVIGIDPGDAAAGTVRLQGSPGSVGAPVAGLGEGQIGTSGVRGPGGGGFGQRMGPMRAQCIKKGGSSEEAECAVLAALRWLKAHQKSDGSWESPRPAAITGLATLAFLGHGHTADDPEFGDTVNKALQFLAHSVDKNGWVKAHGGNMYDHAIVTYAIGEGFGMTQSPALKDPLQRCVNTLLKAQQVPKTKPHHSGGWRYSPNAKDSDTSVTGWCIQALEAAKLAGVEIPDSVFWDASKYLWAMSDSTGVFGYEGPNGKLGAMTAVGVLCQAFMGNGGDHRMKKSLDKLKTLTFDWDKGITGGKFTVYTFYYLTQAMFQGGGSYWEYWNGQFRDALIQHQDQDGHWPLPEKSRKQEEKQGDAYQTALCCLMLEVYYRYLPSYQAIEKGQFEKGVTNIGIHLPKMPDLNKK